MTDTEFIEAVYEIAFGDCALEREYSREEVLAQLKSFSDGALILEEILIVYLGGLKHEYKLN